MKILFALSLLYSYPALALRPQPKDTLGCGDKKIQVLEVSPGGQMYGLLLNNPLKNTTTHVLWQSFHYQDCIKVGEVEGDGRIQAADLGSDGTEAAN